jgi:hypothetical protein
MRANQAQIVASFRFSAAFTAHHYFFQFRICASLRKLGTPLRRHPEVFSLLLLLPFLSILRVFHFFTSSYMYSTFLFCVSYCSFFPHSHFSVFTLSDYIYSCTLHCSIASYNQISFPPRFTPRAHSAHSQFRFRSTCAHRRTLCNISLITSLLLRTRLATFAHPYTCNHPCLFCFGHGQRCVSASANRGNHVFCTHRSGGKNSESLDDVATHNQSGIFSSLDPQSTPTTFLVYVCLAMHLGIFFLSLWCCALARVALEGISVPCTFYPSWFHAIPSTAPL